jgi:hypothetical protein
MEYIELITPVNPEITSLRMIGDFMTPHGADMNRSL